MAIDLSLDLYIDESTSHGASRGRKFYALGAALLSPRQSWEAKQRLDAVDAAFDLVLEDGSDIHFTQLFNARVARVYGLNYEERQQLAHAILNVMIDVKPTLFSAVVDHASHERCHASARLERYALSSIARQGATALEGRGATGRVIYDRPSPREQTKLCEDWEFALARLGSSRPPRFVDGLTFSTGRVSAGIRLADATAWLARRSVEGTSYRHHERVAHLWKTPWPLPVIQFDGPCCRRERHYRTVTTPTP